MKSAVERKMLIAKYISDMRHTTRRELAERFGVSIKSVSRDVQYLSTLYPIISDAGGIHAMDGWYISRRYMTKEQKALVKRLLPGLQTADRATMESLLRAFAKPNL